MPLFKFYFHFQRIKPRSQTQLSPLLSCLANGLCVARCLQESRKGGKRSATGCKVKPWCRQKRLRRVDQEKSALKG